MDSTGKDSQADCPMGVCSRSNTYGTRVPSFHTMGSVKGGKSVHPVYHSKGGHQKLGESHLLCQLQGFIKLRITSWGPTSHRYVAMLRVSSDTPLQWLMTTQQRANRQETSTVSFYPSSLYQKMFQGGPCPGLMCHTGPMSCLLIIRVGAFMPIYGTA